MQQVQRLRTGTHERLAERLRELRLREQRLREHRHRKAYAAAERLADLDELLLLRLNRTRHTCRRIGRVTARAWRWRRVQPLRAAAPAAPAAAAPAAVPPAAAAAAAATAATAALRTV